MPLGLSLLSVLSLVLAAGVTLARPAAAQPSAVAPAPIPSGMELLYSDRVAFQADGEPIVALGLMSGQSQITVRARAQMNVDFYEGEIFKRATVQPGAEVIVTVRRARPAKRLYFVDLEGVTWGDQLELERARTKWLQRGLASVEVIEEGTVLGIGGRVLDNRELRLWLPAASQRDAQREATRLYERWGDRAMVTARLAEHPWAELDVRLGAAPLGRAVSYVRFSSEDGQVQVAQVTYGVGYSWGGREDRFFDGEIYVAVDPEGTLAAVNVVGAERILEGVVPSELFASAHPESLKAQAVAARNQLFAKLGRRHHDDPFHLCSEQHCQVYSGTSREDPRTNEAVLATRGEVLFRETRLVDTVYSSTCGGHTENNDVVWGNKPDPALRGQPDFDTTRAPELGRFAADGAAPHMHDWVATTPPTFCSLASQTKMNKFRWEKTLLAQELQALLTPRFAHLGRLRDVEAHERGRGGRVMTLRLVGERGQTTVLHELPIRKLFGNLNSGAFVIDAERDAAGFLTRLTFRGAGWGHGVGMCQLGAIGRAEAGYRYRDILRHYYNGATVERVYGVDSSQATVAR